MSPEDDLTILGNLAGALAKEDQPPFWTTYDPEVVRAALKRLDEAAG